MKINKRETLPFLLLIPISVVYLLLVNGNWNPSWDSSIYISVGRSLLTGHGYKYMGIPHTKYPFLFPLMLSPISVIFGNNFFLMRLFIVMTALAGIGLTYWLFRRAFGMAIGIAVMLMTAASYTLMSSSTLILSDVPYIPVSLLSLIFVHRYARDEKWSGKSGYICAGLILASFFTRYIALALFAGTLLHLLLDSKGSISLRFKKIALICVIFLIPASAWMARGAILRKVSPPPPGLREFLSYERELVVASTVTPNYKTVSLEELLSRLGLNRRYYQNLAADIVSGKDINSKTRIDVISIIILCGFVYCLIRWRGVFEYYVFFYILMYILWTSLQGVRFLIPIIPFIFYYIIRAFLLIPDIVSFVIKKLTHRGPSWDKYWNWGEGVLIALMVALCIYWNWSSDVNVIRNEHRAEYYSGSRANFFNAMEWVKDNTPPDAVILSGRSPWVYLISGRKTLTPPWIKDTEQIMTSIRRNKMNYAIVTPEVYSYQFLSLVLKERPESFIKIHEIGDCVIYKVLDSDEG